MNNLLVVESSARVSRSITRFLTRAAIQAWRDSRPRATVVVRDVGQQPPPALSEAWIAAAYAPPEQRDAAQRAQLHASDVLVDELLAADAIVFGVPLYNFGMSGQLKAWFDQVVRIGRTFDFTGDANQPYRPLLPPRPLLVVTAAGSTELHPEGALAPFDCLTPHLDALCGFVGLGVPRWVRVGGAETKDERLGRALLEAQDAVARTVANWPRPEPVA